MSLERTPDAALAEMTPAETERRDTLVATVWRHLDGFMEAGAALVEIRDSRLYRETHQTFAAFCADEFSLSRSGAYELMEATRVVSGIPDTAPRPENVGQARALAAAPPEERADVMVEVASKGKVTAENIAVTIKARHPKPPAPPPSPRSPVAEAEPDTCRGGCGTTANDPSMSGGWCQTCLEEQNPSPRDLRPTEAPAPKAKPASTTAWEPHKAISKGLQNMPTAREVMALLPPDSIPEFDHLADEAIAWGKRWKEERKAATRLRLMGVK